MVIVMAPDATPDNIDDLVELVSSVGGEAYVTRGVSRTIIGLVGDVERFQDLGLAAKPGVSDVLRISAPYKLVSRENHDSRTVVSVRGVPIGGDNMTVIAGPCAVETPEQTLEAARMALAAGASLLRGGAYKPRTSPYAFQGLGEQGLKILADVREETGMPIVTEVVDAADVELVASYADMLQVGTRNMQNFALLQAVGDAGKPVLLKRGMSATIDELLLAAEYILNEGNERVILCERGVRSFDSHTRNLLDLTAIPVTQSLSHLPIIADPSHGTGLRSKVIPMARAAVAAGADGLIVEVHPDPTHALSDGAQSLYPEQFDELMGQIRVIARAIERDLVPPLPEPAPAGA